MMPGGVNPGGVRFLTTGIKKKGDAMKEFKKKWYQSMSSGIFAPNIFCLVREVFISLFRDHVVDLRWRVLWFPERSEK